MTDQATTPPTPESELVARLREIEARAKGWIYQPNNPAVIAHARRDIPFLLATIERLRSAHEQGGREGIEMAKRVCETLKAQTDGPRREDWQLGYAAACREIHEAIRALSSAPPGEK